MLTVATMLWDKNERSPGFSQMYNEDWVRKLYGGFARNLTVPWRFLLFTDRPRDFGPEIAQERILDPMPWNTYTEPYRLGIPMMLVGLDTVIIGNVDHLANYCLNETIIAVPRDPYHPERACNGVSLIPEGQKHVYDNWRGEPEMAWIDKQRRVFIDDIFPGQVVSYKGSVRKNGLGNACIVYFHGDQKPHQLKHLGWIQENWRV